MEIRRVEKYPKYFVREDGQIWSLKTNRILRQSPITSGYLSVSIDGPNKRGYAHRLVAEAFIPNPEQKPCVNHINGVKSDNHVDNLEWCTHQENTAHAIATGLMDPHDHRRGRKGSKNVKAKVTEEQVLEIRQSVAEGNPQKVSVEKYNLTKGTISGIVNRKTWRHI